MGNRDISHLRATTELRVTYHDTDQMGHAYYSRHLVWFEIARTELIRSRGKTYRELEQEGVYLPVRECHCRYHAPACYDDLLTITTSVSRLTPASVEFSYRIERAVEGTLIAEGSTLHPFVDADRKVIRAGYKVFDIND